MSWIKIHRGWQDNPVFRNEPQSRSSAWIWLIENAAWKPERKRVGGRIMEIERGQLVASVRELAEAWRWSKDRVHRYLRELREWEMIATASATGRATATNLITICNYSKYQDDTREDATATETDSATEVRQQCDSSAKSTKDFNDLIDPKKERRKEDKKNLKDMLERDGLAFYAAYPRKVAKPKALAAYARARKKTDHATIMAALERYVATKPAYADWAYPASWLNAERWTDEPPNTLDADNVIRRLQEQWAKEDAA